MSDLIRAGIGVFGALIGIPIGGLISAYLLQLIGPLVYGREFRQMSFMLSIFALPAGAMLGAFLGAWTGTRRPRLFFVSFVPAALLLLAWEVTQYHLRRVEEPRVYTVEVTAEKDDFPGRFPASQRRFKGTIHADGIPHFVEGVIPATFTHESHRLNFEITLVDGKKDEWFSIVVLVDGEERTRMSSDLNVTGDLDSLGTGKWTRTGYRIHANHRQDPQDPLLKN